MGVEKDMCYSGQVLHVYICPNFSNTNINVFENETHPDLFTVSGVLSC